MSHERFNNLVTQIVTSHQSRERTIHAGSFEPAKDEGN